MIDTLLGTAALPPAMAAIVYLWLRVVHRKVNFPRLWFAGSLGALAGCLEYHAWPQAGIAAANALLALYFLRRRRKRRRWALTMAGAKSLARRARLVRTMQQRTRLRPVLRPAPGTAAATGTGG